MPVSQSTNFNGFLPPGSTTASPSANLKATESQQNRHKIHELKAGGQNSAMMISSATQMLASNSQSSSSANFLQLIIPNDGNNERLTAIGASSASTTQNLDGNSPRPPIRSVTALPTIGSSGKIL